MNLNVLFEACSVWEHQATGSYSIRGSSAGLLVCYAMKKHLVQMELLVGVLGQVDPA